MNTKKELDRINDDINTLDKTKVSLIRKVWPEYSRYQHEIDDFLGWGCPDSPFGYCAYNTINDPTHDSCLFCGMPQERK